MQNDKFAVTDQVVGTTTTYWKVDSEGKLAQRTVVTFMNNGTEFAKMPVGNNGKVAEPATKPTSTDKVFTGWYTDAEGTIPFNFNNEVGSTTTTLYAGWGDPEVYVPSAPTGAAGAFTAASLAKAVELINSKDAPDLDWTIKINGQLTGKQVISGEIAADTIILIGARDLDANGVPRDMLNGNFTEPTDSAVLNIFATNPVIIKNLKITGGNNSTDLWTGTKICGGGLHVASGANVSLADGAVIAGNKAYAGGGAYVKGIMYMYGSAVIGDANATKAPVGESDCSNYASQYGGGVYVAGGSFYMGCNSCTMSVVNEQAVYEYNYKELTGGVFGNRSNYDGGGVYSSGSYAKVYMNSGVIANNSALKNGGAVRNAAVSGFILSGDAYIPAGADFKHDVYLENGYANVTIDGTLTHEKVAQIMPTKTTTSTSLGYDNKYSDYGSLDDKNNQYGKFTITPFVISETAPNTITYYQYTYVNGYGIKATANGSAQNIPQFTQITLSDNVFGGDVVTATITGENFTNQMLNFTSICLNDTMVNATFTRESATEITATFPAPATAGTHTVKVQTYGAEPQTGTLEVNGADPHTFYVKPGGDDTNNDGLTPNTAFASLQKAVESMNDDDAAYTIKVVGALPGNQKLGKMQGEIGVTGSDYYKPVSVAASSIVLTGNGDSDELSGGGSDAAALTINTDKPVTITNLTITGGAQGGLMIGEGDVQAKVTIADGVKITGNNGASTSGGGVKVGGNSTLTMTGGEISGNSSESATEDYGGGVIVNGTFNMEGGTIKNNTAENGSGVYVYGSANFSIKGNATIENNDVYLATGATIAIVGALEGTGTVATITPQNYPSATSQVQVLSGDYVADAYDRFAVTEQEWEIDSDGYLKKALSGDVMTHNNISSFYPEEGKSYSFVFDNTVTDDDLVTFCTNCGNLKRSSTLDMSQATSITNVDRLPAYLISVVLPPNVESISSDAFTDIAFRGEATSVTIADGNAHYKTIDGVLFGEIERWGTGISNLLFYPPAKSGSTYEIPSFVIRIEDCGFMYNKNLETINGLDRIEYLQTFVFVECQKLKSANLSGATMVGYNLFRNCPALESVTLGAADMLWAVFADCPKLEQIHFTSATPPSYLGEYGDYPVEFYGCNPNLKFYVPAGSRNAYLNATGDNGFYSSANACYDGNTYGYGGSLADRIIEESTGYIGSKVPGSQLAIGDIVFNDGSATAYVEGLTLDENQKAAAVAVIFYTDGGSLGTKTLGVGLVQSSGKWGDDSNISDINDENNGANNLSWVKTYCDGDLNNNIHFPLFSWADKYGSTNNLTGNWYPPAINELSAIWQNKTLINNAMGALGKTALSGNYWSSTDNGEGMAKYVDMSSGVSYDYMTTTYNFVAIRVFE